MSLSRSENLAAPLIKCAIVFGEADPPLMTRAWAPALNTKNSAEIDRPQAGGYN